MIAETCPITVRTVTAHLDTGRAVYGEQASAICELPVEPSQSFPNHAKTSARPVRVSRVMLRCDSGVSM